MSGIHAVRVAARLRRELGIEVEAIRGHYGEYKVIVDGDTVVDGGAWVIVGVMPAARTIVETVRARLAARGGPTTGQAPPGN